MPAPAGNQFWKARAKHGRDKIFSSPQDLWVACVEYFEWVESNPLWEAKVTQYQGVPVDMTLPKMRAMTISGLCLFLDICEDTWANYRKNEDFFGVISKAEKVIYNQKLSGAAADLLNANIIARELGLKDQVSKEVSGPGGGPQAHTHIVSEMDAKEASRLYKDMLKGE